MSRPVHEPSVCGWDYRLWEPPADACLLQRLRRQQQCVSQFLRFLGHTTGYPRECGLDDQWRMGIGRQVEEQRDVEERQWRQWRRWRQAGGQ